MESFSKLLWLELIGLDNTKDDFGVTEFLSRMPVKPEIISLFLWYSELIHSHTDLRQDTPIGPKHCAYHARPRNEERERQDWTKFQLRKLIALFHQAGVKVYVCFFDQLESEEYQRKYNIPIVHEWIDDHPELRTVDLNGKQGMIGPLKRLSDNTFYEDFLFSQLERFMRDYGFDGLHAADGFAHPRMPLCQADFSEDMLEQFQNWSHCVLQGETCREKGEWLLRNLRKEWSLFHCQRHAQFWEKGMAMLERNHWGHCFNTCWTRDPLEAIWRYGVDYRKLADVGVRNFVQEAQAAVVETEGWNHCQVPMQDIFRAVSTQLKAYLPECNLFLLHCIKDGREQYNMLRHAPAFMDSDVFSLVNTFSGNGRALCGAMTCLSDGIQASEWQRIDQTYCLAFQGEPDEIPFPRIVWSDQALHRMLDVYARKRIVTPFFLHASLLSQGAVLFGSLRLEDIPRQDSGPLVVLHPALYDNEDLAKVRSASGGNYALIGLFDDDSFGFELNVNNERTETLRTDILPPEKRDEPVSWLDELPQYKPDSDFILKISQSLNHHFALFHPADHQPFIRTWGFLDKNRDLHLFAGNEKRTYVFADILLKVPFSSVTLLSNELVLPPFVRLAEDGMHLLFKIPPSGTIPLLLKRDNSSASTKSGI